jgi:ubiquinone/menaquinone biosynthesis C-methylase UbiE
MGITRWKDEVSHLLGDVLGVRDLSTQAAINVGIGNGREGKDFYDKFGSFMGVDISTQALEQAQTNYHPFMLPLLGSAERLENVASNSIDTYLSFRTMQSTLLDRSRAMFSAYRVLRSGGRLLISIPNTYIDQGKVKFGLLRPHGNILDPELPYTYIGEIRRTLFRLGFQHVGVRTGMVEVYVYAQKPT